MLFDLFSVDPRGRFFRFISEKMKKRKLKNNVENKKTILNHKVQDQDEEFHDNGSRGG